MRSRSAYLDRYLQDISGNLPDPTRDGEITWNAYSIKALRIYKGLNQEQFASELGVRRETVSEWENSKYEPDLPGH